ncbi:MAG: hypothetical protein IKG58_01180 [Bacilli bacterium]|nr:hypothetical protein [Bacilli bacterium]
MKKKLIILFILLFISIFIHIPKYVELNNLAIIDGIGVYYKDNSYYIYLKEIIPIKDQLGINKEYKYYYVKSKDIESGIKELNKNSKKKLYYKSCNYIVTNMNTSSKILNSFNISTKKIYHNKKVLNKLKKTN